MLIVNNITILRDKSILIDVDNTKTDEYPVSIRLWNMLDYKSESKAIDLTKFIEGTSKRQIINVATQELGLDLEEIMFFVEIRTNNPEEELADVVVYDLAKYYRCLADSLKKEYSNIGVCTTSFSQNGTTVLISLLIEAIDKSLSIGEYNKAIELTNNLKKVCSNFSCGCSNKSANLSQFKQI